MRQAMTTDNQAVEAIKQAAYIYGPYSTEMSAAITAELAAARERALDEAYQAWYARPGNKGFRVGEDIRALKSTPTAGRPVACVGCVYNGGCPMAERRPSKCCERRQLLLASEIRIKETPNA